MQGILTYCATPTLPYHLYADEWELLVLPAPLPSVRVSKKEFFDRLSRLPSSRLFCWKMDLPWGIGFQWR